MCILFSIFVVEVTVISGSGNTEVRDVQYGLDFIVDIQRVVYGLIDAHFPFLFFWTETFHHDFPSDFNHVVPDAFTVEQAGYRIAAVSFGNGAAIQYYPRFLFHNLSVFQSHLFKSDERKNAVDLCRSKILPVFEAEPPGIDQRCDGYVECAVGMFADGFGQLEYVDEHAVRGNFLIPVDSANDRFFIEGRERDIHFS